jgi:AmmeMemoRadiSam system protein A
VSDRRPLAEIERAILLRIARDAIESAAASRSPARFPEERDGALARPGACFVTLRIEGELRGCIGTLEAERPLAETARDMAIAAAQRDPRFSPLDTAEVRAVKIAVSVLTPRSVVAGPSEVRIGTHGVAIRRGPARGVLLPQVAIERGWDREAFLAATCQKAGLPRDAWRDPTTVIEVFASESVEESQASG